MTHNNQSLRISSFWNFRHRLVRFYWYEYRIEIYTRPVSCSIAWGRAANWLFKYHCTESHSSVFCTLWWVQKHDWLYFRMIFSWLKSLTLKGKTFIYNPLISIGKALLNLQFVCFLQNSPMTLTWKGSLSVCYPKPQKGRCVFEGLAPSPLVAHFDGLLNPEVGVENCVGGCSIGNGELTTWRKFTKRMEYEKIPVESNWPLFFEGWPAPFYGSNLPKHGSFWVLGIYIFIFTVYTYLLIKQRLFNHLRSLPIAWRIKRYKYMAIFRDFQLVVLMITPDSARLTAETMGMTSSC